MSTLRIGGLLVPRFRCCEILTYIKYLRGNYKTCLFSNSIDTLSHKKKINKKIKSHFNYIFNSYNIDFKKPKIKPFQFVLNKLQMILQECVIIDDEGDKIYVAKSWDLS